MVKIEKRRYKLLITLNFVRIARLLRARGIFVVVVVVVLQGFLALISFIGYVCAGSEKAIVYLINMNQLQLNY